MSEGQRATASGSNCNLTHPSEPRAEQFSPSLLHRELKPICWVDEISDGLKVEGTLTTHRLSSGCSEMRSHSSFRSSQLWHLGNCLSHFTADARKHQ